MAIATPYYYELQVPHYRHSNIYGSFDTTAAGPVTYITSASGVVKRIGWRNLSQPQLGEPLGYHKRWEWHNNVRSRLDYNEQGPDGFGGITHNYNYESFVSTINAWDGRDMSVINDADYKAISKLLKQLQGEGTNIANMIAERKQTVNMVGKTATRLAYAIRDLKRGNIASAIRRIGGDPKTARKLKGKDISGMWLELQYGWKPMLSDVYGLVNKLHERELIHLQGFHASSSAFKTQKSLNTWSTNKGQRPWGTRRTTATVKYTVRAHPNRSLASPAALGMTNPLVPLWEVVPWSFVVDWFLPIGNYLEQLSATHGWNFYDGCKSLLVNASEVAGDSYATSSSAAGWSYSTNASVQGDSKVVEFTRTTLGGFPVPPLPTFKSPFSAAHALNGIALLHQVVKGKKIANSSPLTIKGIPL